MTQIRKNVLLWLLIATFCLAILGALFADTIAFAEEDAPNIVPNGDFEAGNDGMAHWALGNAPKQLETEIVHGGNYSLKFSVDGTGSVNPAYYIQSIAFDVEKDTIYLFEYWLNIQDASEDLMFSTFAFDPNQKLCGWIDFSSPITYTNTEGWVKVQSLISMANADSDGKIHIGFKAYSGTATAYIDDVSMTAVKKTSEVGLNLDFEEQVNGMIPNWNFSGDGYAEVVESEKSPETTGNYTVKMYHKGASTGNPSVMTSQNIPVEGGKTYELNCWTMVTGDYTADSYVQFLQTDANGNNAYGVVFDANASENNYQGTSGGEWINPTYQYHVFGESQWRKVTWTFTVADNASYIKARLILFGKNATAYYDDITITEVEGATERDAANLDFENVKEDGMPQNWHLSGSRSYESSLTSDNTVYHDGSYSAHVVSTGTIERTLFENSIKIPVEAGTTYELSSFFTSANCDPTVQLTMRAYYYDENGNHVFNVYGDKLFLRGGTSVLNRNSQVDEWKQLYSRITVPNGTAYMSIAFLLSAGHAEVWFDDARLIPVEEANSDTILEYNTQFDTKDNFGSVADFTLSGEGATFDLATSENGGGALLTATNGGEVSHKVDSFTTGYKYRVYINYVASKDAHVVIDFYNTNSQKIAGASVSKVLEKDKNICEFNFESPSAYYAVIRLGVDGEGTLQLKEMYTYQTGLPSTKGMWDAEWVWYPENPVTDAVEQYRYFRYTFNLSDYASYAPLQLTADDKYQIYVNGQYVDSNWEVGGDSWGDVQILYLDEYLVPGKNVIAIKSYNLISEAGVLFDGKITLKNGETVTLKSDNTVKSAKTVTDDVDDGERYLIPDWATTDFDDSSWTLVKTFGKPPVSPWGPVYYNNTLYVENSLEIVSVEHEESVQAGNSIDFEVVFKANVDIKQDLTFKVDLMPRNSFKVVATTSIKIVGDDKTSTWTQGNEYKLTLRLDVPSFLDAGKYQLRLDDSTITLANTDFYDNKFVSFTVTENPDKDNPLIATVEEYNGAPTIMINDQPYSPAFYLRPDLNVYRQTDAEERIGESTYELFITYQGCLGKGGQDVLWPSRDKIDYDAFDKAIISLLSASPSSYVMVNFGMFAPSWWRKENPGELTVSMDENGNVTTGEGASFASEKWMEESGEVLRKLIQHMKEQSYYNRVYGLRITAGQTYEFMNYGTTATRLPDYSEAALKAFRTWLKEKYVYDSLLSAAWGEHVTFETAQIPTIAERQQSTYGTLYDSKKDRKALDYNTFLTQLSAKSLLYWAQICKEETGNDKIVGAYFGYLWTFGSYDGVGSTHSALNQVLNSPYIDFVASPINYNERLLGESTTYMSLLDTIQAYGKLYIQEQDNRTFKSTSYSGVGWDSDWDFQVGGQRTIEGTIQNFKRDFANNFVNGAGFWHYDMYGGWLDDPMIYEQMATEKRIYDNSLTLENRSFLNDVAVFVSDKMYSYTAMQVSPNSPYVLINSLFLQQRKNLATMGVGYDTYAISTLVDGKVPSHKVNIFLSPFEITDEAKAAIEAYLKKDNQYAIWIYLPGFSDGNETSAERMSDLVGINLKLDNEENPMQVKIADDNHWLTTGIKDKIYGTDNTFISPLCYVDDSSATALGYLTQHTDKVGLAVKKYDNWTSIYSTATCLPVEMLRNVLKEAGVHVYSENTNDVIYNNNHYVALHSAVGEEKTIKLDGTYAVYDEFEQKYISYGTDTITYTHVANDTKIFRLETPFTPSEDPDPSEDPEPTEDTGLPAWAWWTIGGGSAVACGGIATAIVFILKKKKLG